VSTGPSIPEGPAFTEEWRELDRDARRRIRRAVNRAQAAEDPREAALAVAVARGQQRFWRFGWVIGPVLAMLLSATEPLQVILANGLFGTILLVVLAFVFVRRAKRAEARNLEVAARKRKKGAKGKPGKPRKKR
jgi:hypothetical protein